jgi:NitT/TauT family transport system permease protein/taurine transport system permease protein
VSPFAIRTAIIAALLLAWELVPRLGLIPALFLSPLSASLEIATHSYPLYLANLWTTLWEIALGLVIACGGGVVLGGVVGAFSFARGLLLPLISSAYAVPFVVLYPLITVWLGIGSASKIAFAGIYGLIPVLLTTAAGVQSIDRNLILTARSLGASGFTLIFKVRLPATIPAVLAAIKLGAALVVVGVIVAEMLVSTAGIGYLIAHNRTVFNTPEVYLGILVVLGIAWSVERLLSLLERRFANWSLHTQKNRT